MIKLHKHDFKCIAQLPRIIVPQAVFAAFGKVILNKLACEFNLVDNSFHGNHIYMYISFDIHVY